jgi:hypothetical protein
MKSLKKEILDEVYLMGKILYICIISAIHFVAILGPFFFKDDFISTFACFIFPQVFFDGIGV